MPDKPNDQQPSASSSSPIPTSDDPGAATRSLALLDAIYDDLGDEEIARDGPIDARAHRLVAHALRMVDELPGRRRESARSRQQSRGDPAAGDGAPVAPMDVASIDTARIVALDRPQLEGLVADLLLLRGGSVGMVLACLSDDELRTMARSLR